MFGTDLFCHTHLHAEYVFTYSRRGLKRHRIRIQEWTQIHGETSHLTRLNASRVSGPRTVVSRAHARTTTTQVPTGRLDASWELCLEGDFALKSDAQVCFSLEFRKDSDPPQRVDYVRVYVRIYLYVCTTGGYVPAYVYTRSKYHLCTNASCATMQLWQLFQIPHFVSILLTTFSCKFGHHSTNAGLAP